MFVVVYSDYISSLCSIYLLRPYLPTVEKQKKPDGILFYLRFFLVFKAVNVLFGVG